MYCSYLIQTLNVLIRYNISTSTHGIRIVIQIIHVTGRHNPIHEGFIGLVWLQNAGRDVTEADKERAVLHGRKKGFTRLLSRSVCVCVFCKEEGFDE